MTTKHSILVAVVLTIACGGKEKADHDEKGHDEKGHDEKGEKGHDEKGHGEGKVIHLEPAQVKAANIQVAKVEIRKETAVLEATGQIVAADDGQARVGVRVPGRITALKASVGQVVKKGQTLALIESPELGRAKADYVSAAAASRLARENAAREKLLFERKISAEVEWRTAEAEAVRSAAELQAAENRLHALGIGEAGLPDRVAHFTSTFAAVSPIDGVVVERPVTLGEMVNPDKT
ncbi:MAG TPA: efflux RND transporter periplasmic adaptor subunit, partial [Kofleriaceae bacterium]